MVFTTEPPYLPIFGLFISKLFRSPYVLIVYDIYPDVIWQLDVLPKTNLIIRLWSFANRFVFSQAKKIVVLSEPMVSKILNYCPESLNNISIIPSWSDIDLIKPLDKCQNWFSQKYSLLDKFVVMYSGNQGRCHDLETIIYAANNLRNNSSVIFLFIGDGAQHAFLKELCNRLNLSNVLFLPYQRLEDTPYSLASADVAIVSLSRDTDALVAPSKLYGHLAAGTPVAVISPESSYLREIVEEHSCGKWFMNDDFNGLSNWITQLSLDPTKLNSYVDVCRGYVTQNASPQVICPKYLDVFLN